ncbi:MAG: hypothetical protein ABL986_08995, partial [Vicinamibacterales bacterium]
SLLSVPTATSTIASLGDISNESPRGHYQRVTTAVNAAAVTPPGGSLSFAGSARPVGGLQSGTARRDGALATESGSFANHQTPSQRRAWPRGAAAVR